MHTDVEGVGGLSSIKFQLKEVASLGIVSKPEGHTQD